MLEPDNVFVFSALGDGMCIWQTLHRLLAKSHRAKIIAFLADGAILSDRTWWNVNHYICITSLAFEHEAKCK